MMQGTDWYMPGVEMDYHSSLWINMTFGAGRCWSRLRSGVPLVGPLGLE